MDVFNLGVQTPAVIELLAAAKLTIQPRGLVTDVLILAPNMAAAMILTQFALHVLGHPVEMIDLGAEPPTAVESVAIVVSTVVLLFVVLSVDRAGGLFFFVVSRN